jgi:transposase
MKNIVGKKRNSYDAEFKLRVVLESMQRDTTIEEVKVKYGVSSSVINKWRKKFKENASQVFDRGQGKKTSKKKPEDSPEYLKKLIGDLTVENTILKKALSVWD